MLYECSTTTYKGHLVPTKIHRYIYSNGKKYILWKKQSEGPFIMMMARHLSHQSSKQHGRTRTELTNTAYMRYTQMYLTYLLRKNEMYPDTYLVFV